MRNSTKAVFSIKDIAKVLNNTEKYASLFMYRLKKRNLVSEVEKSKYALSETDVLCVASSLIYPSYISFYEALSFYKATTQIPKVIEIIASRSKKKIYYDGYFIQFIKFKKNLMFGFKKEYLQGKIAFIAEPEKLIVDCLLLNRTPLNDVFILIKSKQTNCAKLIEYAKKTNSGVIIKRLGYLLEKSNLNYASLLKQSFSIKYEKLNTIFPSKGQKDKKWRLIINEVIE